MNNTTHKERYRFSDVTVSDILDILQTLPPDMKVFCKDDCICYIHIDHDNQTVSIDDDPLNLDYYDSDHIMI